MSDEFSRREALRTLGAASVVGGGLPVLGSAMTDGGLGVGGGGTAPHDPGNTIDPRSILQSDSGDQFERFVRGVLDRGSQGASQIGTGLRVATEWALDQVLPPFQHTLGPVAGVDRRIEVKSLPVQFSNPTPEACGVGETDIGTIGLYLTVFEVTFERLIEDESARRWVPSYNLRSWVGIDLDSCVYAGSANYVDLPGDITGSIPELPSIYDEVVDRIEGVKNANYSACARFCPDREVNPVEAPVDALVAWTVTIVEEVAEAIERVVEDITGLRLTTPEALVVFAVTLTVAIAIGLLVFVVDIAVPDPTDIGAPAKLVVYPAATVGLFLVGTFALESQIEDSATTPALDDLSDVARDPRLDGF